MDLTEAHQLGDFYLREIPEKTFLIKHCGASIQEVNQIEIAKSMVELVTDIPYDDEMYVSWEFGAMREDSPQGTAYYAFAEIPPETEIENKRTIPAGTYLCRQSKDSQLENASEIFKDHGKNFLAIETYVLVGRHKIDKPLSELRVILERT